MSLLLIASAASAAFCLLHDASARIWLISLDETGAVAEVGSSSIFRKGRTISLRKVEGRWVHAESGRRPLFGLGHRVDDIVRRRVRCHQLRENGLRRRSCAVPTA